MGKLPVSGHRRLWWIDIAAVRRMRPKLLAETFLKAKQQQAQQEQQKQQEMAMREE